MGSSLSQGADIVGRTEYGWYVAQSACMRRCVTIAVARQVGATKRKGSGGTSREISPTTLASARAANHAENVLGSTYGRVSTTAHQPHTSGQIFTDYTTIKDGQFLALPLSIFDAFVRDYSTKQYYGDEPVCNALEVLLMLCLFSTGHQKDQIAICFEMFDLDGGGSICRVCEGAQRTCSVASLTRVVAVAIVPG